MALKQNQLSNLKYRPDIDGLRAIAVLSVVIFHAFPSLIKGGFIGVDVFFVISGYVISSIIFNNLNKDTFNFSDFYVRRINRIFPALILVLVLSMIFGWAVLLSDEYKQLGKHVAAASGFVSNFLLWSESGYFDNAIETKPLMHLWSLGIEEQFYIIWPALTWAAWKMRLNFILLAISFGLISLYLNVEGISKDAVSTFYSPQTRFWELMIGSSLAWVNLPKVNKTHSKNYPTYMMLCVGFKDGIFRLNKKVLLNLSSLAGSVILIYGFSFINKGLPFPGLWAIIPSLGAYLIIQAGPDAWINKKILSNRITVWFGLISYPLYLWHWPLLAFARIIENETPSKELRIALVCLSISLAWLTYKLVESPIRSSEINKVKFSIITFILMALIGSIGYLNHKISFIRPHVSIMKGNSSALTSYDKKIMANPDYISNMLSDRQNAIRAPLCHFNKPNQSFEDYKVGIDKCLNIDKSRRNILIVGDSHAADLYFALRETDPKVNLLQATGAGCTAIRKFYKDSSQDCFKLVDFAIKFAETHQIDTVLLESRWPENFEAMASDITELKKSVKNIILVGPPVEFTEDVNKFISRRSRDEDINKLSRKYINKQKILLNDRMKDFAKLNNVRFIDRVSMFCNFRGVCNLVSDQGDLYIVDYGHLLRPGAKYFGGKLIEYNLFN